MIKSVDALNAYQFQIFGYIYIMINLWLIVVFV